MNGNCFNKYVDVLTNMNEHFFYNKCIGTFKRDELILLAIISK